MIKNMINFWKWQKKFKKKEAELAFREREKSRRYL